jgi:hypothetical protein
MHCEMPTSRRHPYALRHTVLLRQRRITSSRHDAWRMEHDSRPFDQASNLNLWPEQSRLAYIICVLDTRGFRYDIKNGALPCRAIRLKCHPPSKTLLTSAQSGLPQQYFLGVTFRSIALHGGVTDLVKFEN